MKLYKVCTSNTKNVKLYKVCTERETQRQYKAKVCQERERDPTAIQGQLNHFPRFRNRGVGTDPRVPPLVEGVCINWRKGFAICQATGDREMSLACYRRRSEIDKILPRYGTLLLKHSAPRQPFNFATPCLQYFSRPPISYCK